MKKKPSFGGPQKILLGIIIVFALIATLTKLTDYTQNISSINYKEFLEKVRGGQVNKVYVAGQQVEGVLKNGQSFQTIVAERERDFDLFEKHGVDFSVASSSATNNFWQIILFFLALGLLGAAGAWYMSRQAKNGANRGGSGGIFSIGKSRAKMLKPSEIKVKFSDVAGAHEAKEELEDIVDFLKNPKKYAKIGARIPRGALLVGEPGTGKTLLARAVAGEANCPFFSVSGSDFIEVFVGVGASRVRDLFAQAKKNAPCIVFIDEIDAVGRQRGSGLGGGNDEREQTLNQLLTEMDGFEESAEPVIVLAATNLADVLDKALLRPGRFDRTVEVPVPDLVSREAILSVHLKKIAAQTDLDVKRIARGTPGYTGADLANLVNEAAIIASKLDLKVVTMQEFEEARDKLMLGKESKTMIISEEDRRVTAYHEAGHALIRLLTPKNTDPLHKITIIPRGRALGVTHYLPEKEKYNRTKDELLANIASALGGRAAEELVFNEISTGASSDFKSATSIARSMVCAYGMSDSLGKMVYPETYNGRTLGYSQKTFEKIDQEIKDILDQQYDIVMKMLADNRDKLNLLSETLLEKETMYASEVYELLGIEPRENHKLV
jgi:cell division protease FtsH